ncbi:hypothetical protein [Hymenobacter latericus]|uniref:hypothetical protein n=1 Tax=Hymenobacter sp. YIM 151858-1 TaxID=2987688 RepID=UPI002225C06A|nr:hypothetical protein [Hymenobacter sp. YIM 151858-1]UYZ60768.1 hypothetical protein OIS50_08185 [Hymenobacter sp. YIM 151858-1]
MYRNALRRAPAFLLGATLLLGCKKEEVAPQTGNLVIRFNNSSLISGTTCYLFTEQLWAAPYAASALREAKVPAAGSTANPGTVKIGFNDLNAGNYVFVVGSNRWAVQVTAGKTNEVSK